MRVSMQNLYSNNLHSLQNSTIDIAKINQMMSTGKSILAPSDNPIGSVKVMASQRDMAETNQYLSNIDSLSNSLSRAETSLSGLVDLEGRMREITIAASNGSLSPEDRASYAAELEHLLESFVDTLNAQDEGGNYLFSGNLTTTAPITKDASGNYVYSGDNGVRDVQVSGSSWMQGNINAEDFIFSNASGDILNQTQDFLNVLKDPNLSPGDAGFDNISEAMLTNLNESLNSISSAITDMGGKQNSLSLIQSAHEERILFNEEVVGDTEGLDYAQATAEFNIKLTALKVTQQAFVQVASLTLFNHMN